MEIDTTPLYWVDLKEQVQTQEFSYKKIIEENIAVEDILNVIVDVYGISTEELYRIKNRPFKEKKIALYLIKNLTVLTNQEIGNSFGLSPSAVSKAAGSAEKLMEEDKLFKKKILMLVSRFNV